MKLTGRDAIRYFARPDPSRAGLLIFGADTMRVALRRQEVLLALLGPEGEAEMRLARIPAADLRKDPAVVSDAMRASGFFPGQRAVFVEDAGDAAAPVIAAALSDWRPGDAFLLVVAGSLTPKSALRKAFEDNGNAHAIGLYDDPPGPEEIAALLSQAGLNPDREASTDLTALARGLDPGDFRQLIEKLSLYKYGDSTPVTPANVAACAPATVEAEADDLLHLVAESRTRAIGPMLRRLESQGIAPVTLCIAATRHFRTLHMAVVEPGYLSRARPPVPFKARDRMEAQAKNWGLRRLEDALRLLIDTDLLLRSSQKAPAMALMERALLRLSEMNRRAAG